MNFNDPMRNEFLYDQDRLERHIWKQERETGLTRRDILKKFLAAGAAFAAAGTFVDRASAQTPPTILKPIDPAKFWDRGTNRETRFEAFKGTGYLTPASLFFVRNHTSTQILSASTWSVSIEGPGVANPRTFTLEDLAALPQVSQIRAIECAGNGRSFYSSQQGTAGAGTAWYLGAIGVGKWTGVRLSDLLDLAGIKSSAVDVIPEGNDVFSTANNTNYAPTDGGGRVNRPLSKERATDSDVLVVTHYNDEPLLPDHGFPARLLVPGWIGIANIKWLRRIIVTESPVINSYFNSTQYTFIGGNYGPLTNSSIRLGSQVVKSAFELPLPSASFAPGLKLITGRSWSAHGTIARVDVSFDDGVTWKRAVLKNTGNEPQAWAEWQIQWTAKAGSYVFKARATDSLGNIQPDTTPFNTNGYLFDAVVRHPVTVA